MLGARETISSMWLRFAAVALLATLVAIAIASSGSAAGPSGLERAIVAQEQHTSSLLARSGVVGTGVSQDASGEGEIVVLATHPVEVPPALSGVDVEVTVTGPITALKLKARKKPSGGGGTTEPAPTGRFPRPVPIGVSTGNAGECSAGTIGARVSDAAGNVYALSNNHVYARGNKAAIGSQILQPGLYDTGCAFSAANVIGSLSAFEPIVYSATASNTIDAAIASTTASQLGTATPSNGYGEPSSAAVAATPGLPVQKYGRTSSLTAGTVTAVNGIVNVSYGAGTARFVDQVFVESQKPFLKSGDSGSLLVTRDAGANPVGLLFASGSSGKFAIANRIDLVLGRFGVEVDGK